MIVINKQIKQSILYVWHSTKIVELSYRYHLLFK